MLPPIVPNPPERIAGWLRAVLVLVGLSALTPLAIATRLQPSSEGLGTHHQLGLPPCTLRTLVGIRCPSCGMTTSWAYMVRGRAPSSFAVNSGGALLALAAMIVGPWSLVSAIRGSWWGGAPNEWTFAGVSLTVMIVTLLDWCVRLVGERYG